VVRDVLEEYSTLIQTLAAAKRKEEKVKNNVGL